MQGERLDGAENQPAEQTHAPGWYGDGGGLRYWDGECWTEHRAPVAATAEPGAKTLIWALSLGCGVAGALAWNAPVLAYYWPLGLGGASLALGAAAATTKGRTPWFALVAVIAALISLSLGIDGSSQIDDARESFNQFP